MKDIFLRRVEMAVKNTWLVFLSLMITSMIVIACTSQTPIGTTAAPSTKEAAVIETPTAAPFIIGMLLVGPYNDNGWSTATYIGGQYIVAKIPDSRLIYVDHVNSTDNPRTTSAQFANQLLTRGAKVIIFNSEDMKGGVIEFAAAHPNIPVIWLSGDYAWKEGQSYHASMANESDIMGRMEYGKMIAGCAAALTTKTGKIGYLGSLINDETRRLVNASFLGAKCCWENIAHETSPLVFQVTWINKRSYTPGETLDPAQVADTFFNSGFDIIISGIDTTEAVIEASKYRKEGKDVYAIQYDYKEACNVAPAACLGVPYFNWGVMMLPVIQSIVNGQYSRSFTWSEPDWKDINDPETSAVGFVKSQGLSAENSAKLDSFIADLAGGLNLWQGPLNYKDGTPFLAEDVAATDQQVWYMPQLLEGMLGNSASK
jgi:simple sugar transport system substrate-binding protein